MIEVAIVDDHELIRTGLRLIIEKEPSMQLLFEATNRRDLLSFLQKHDPDILIMDLNLGDSDGMETIESVTRHYPSLPILVLSTYPEELYALFAFKQGILGYLNKSVVSEELIEAIETVVSGKHYISRSFKEKLPYGTTLAKENRELTSLLSKRETEVMSLLAQDKSSKEIAEIMGISPKTVSTYKVRIMDKLSISSASHLQRLAYELFSS